MFIRSTKITNFNKIILCLKFHCHKPGIVAHICNHRTLKAENQQKTIFGIKILKVKTKILSDGTSSVMRSNH